MSAIAVAIVGGGITGLSAAHALRKAGVAFRLLEGSARFGGVIRSDRVSGFLLEGGPDSLLAQKPEGVGLVRELGLGDRLVPTNPDVRAIFVLHRGRLEPLPEGMMLAVPSRILPFLRSGLFSWPGKLRMGLDSSARAAARTATSPSRASCAGGSGRSPWTSWGSRCWRGSTPATPSGSRSAPRSRASWTSRRATAA
jgi:protoporphyrinogen oxidase